MKGTSLGSQISPLSWTPCFTSRCASIHWRCHQGSWAASKRLPFRPDLFVILVPRSQAVATDDCVMRPHVDADLTPVGIRFADRSLARVTLLRHEHVPPPL